MRVLVIRQDHLGDVLLMTPLIRALARGGATVTLACRRSVQPAIEGNPHVHECQALEDIGGDFERSPWTLGRWIRSRKFDACLLLLPDPPCLIWAVVLGGVRRRLTAGGGIAARLCGFQQVRTGLPDTPRHYAEAHLDFAAAIGFAADGAGLDWFVADAEKDWARGFLSARGRLQRPVVGIHPGCGGNTCNLRGAEYGRVAGFLLQGAAGTVIITGGAGDVGLIDEWDSTLLNDRRMVNTVGKLNLRQLGALIGEMDLLVAPSTGPLHIASALGVQTLSPFCGRIYLRPAVWGNHNGRGHCLSPKLAACELWARTHRGFCDFRREVTAVDLAAKADELLRRA